jgi:tRNA threonylcarbamoyl adenosine modification protein (Sua5/YciO/YrdC/YwlC family)
MVAMSTVRALDDRAAVHDEIVAALRTPELVVVPTDTVYGVIADAFNPKATMALRDAKELAPTAPLTVFIRSPRQVSGLVSEIPEAADRLMASYWPGPLTIVLPATDGLTWDVGTRTVVALRMPTDDLLLELIGEVGPLVCSAAARPVDEPPRTAADAQAALGEHVALYVDGGARTAPWSTIVDLTRDHATVLREGAVASDDVELVAAGRVGWGQVPQAGETPPPAGEAPPAGEGTP